MTHTERPRVTYKAYEARNPRVRSFVRSRVRARALPLVSYLPISPFERSLIRGRRSPHDHDHDRLLFPPPLAPLPRYPSVPLSDSRLAPSTHVARSLCPLPSPRVISHSLACTRAIVYACARVHRTTTSSLGKFGRRRVACVLSDRGCARVGACLCGICVRRGLPVRPLPLPPPPGLLA